ncbi:helix-turn-helix domain-containing protein [Paenibacillus alginolyticus]|uniref:helix-turn-helix domain-containing protein n=1 Tax=Paenibacillus alginolyticus TaxID=59839 RepID=UPI000415CAE4|nr:helix-turn-helix domain-containing protein [Paenibacillus alginolyticus]MCY9666550.1 helix-turn-helix domain-containing protein [Paenibacillus alginolyticus]
MKLGEKIRYIRKSNQMNQKEFADSIAVSQGTLSDIERGNGYPSCETIIALKMAFKCDLNWLIDEESDSESNNQLFGVNVSVQENALIQLLRSLPDMEKDEFLQIAKIKAKKNNIGYPN